MVVLGYLVCVYVEEKLPLTCKIDTMIMEISDSLACEGLGDHSGPRIHITGV